VVSIVYELRMSKKLTREELIEIVRKIMNCEGTEKEIDEYIDILEENVPHPEVSDLIFYPERGEPTPEEVVDQAMAYKKLLFGPGGD
jgi:Colicin immunity protein / pyocin immunity protein